MHRIDRVKRRRYAVWVHALCTTLFAACTALWQPAGAHASALPHSASETVQISVLSLFHPVELRLQPASGSSLVLEIGGRRLPLSPDGKAVVTRSGKGMVTVVIPGRNRKAQGPRLSVYPQSTAPAPSADFWLEVPGKLRRQYTGTLEIRTTSKPGPTVLQAIITMPMETAVASIVQAESPPSAGLEALKAQAVAARSFLAARQTAHTGFDFCDTTHCQFLRSPPASTTPAARATQATSGLILTWSDPDTAEDRPLAAMYTRSCGGRTRTLREIGLPSQGYPYYAVRCIYCSRHPEAWKREVGGLSHLSERDRLAYNRIHGWAALPGFGSRQPNGSIQGTGIGHGIGLCQLGAAEMARSGAHFTEILAHYYPNTRIATLQ